MKRSKTPANLFTQHTVPFTALLNTRVLSNGMKSATPPEELFADEVGVGSARKEDDDDDTDRNDESLALVSRRDESRS